VADWVSDQWDAWRSIPHARLWRDADWQFALDTIELAAQAFQDGAKVGLFTQLRYREKVLGTTWSARQDMRIRYIEPSSSAPAIVDAAADSHQDSTPHPCVKGNLMGRMVLRAHRDSPHDGAAVRCISARRRRQWPGSASCSHSLRVPTFYSFYGFGCGARTLGRQGVRAPGSN